MTSRRPQAPPDLSTRGRKFWRATVRDYELTTGERELLHEACRAMDQIDALAAAVARDGHTIAGSQGQTVLHPAIGEARQQQITLSRLLAALELPTEDDEHAGTVIDPQAAQISAKASRAAQARWKRHNMAKTAGGN